MTNLITSSEEILSTAGYSTQNISTPTMKALVFENSVCFGFLFAYDTTEQLLRQWNTDSDTVIQNYGLLLRLAGEKAWNVYVVLIAGGTKDDKLQPLLANIEENLIGTRKIARDGVSSAIDLRSALLALLPIQSAPKLEAVDMVSEIRLRASDVDQRSVDAFLSTVSESILLHVLEETK